MQSCLHEVLIDSQPQMPHVCGTQSVRRFSEDCSESSVVSGEQLACKVSVRQHEVFIQFNSISAKLSKDQLQAVVTRLASTSFSVLRDVQY